jgi:tetratricopeptide (TPR) repeat protein
LASPATSAGRGIAILDGIASLIEQSLLREEGEDEPRFWMLETMREYAGERLEASGEEASMRERHLAWFAQYCEDAIAAWNSTDQATLLRRLDADLENIRTALACGLEPGGAGIPVLRLASALGRYWITRGLVSEGRRWTARALDAAPQASAGLRATALNRCALLARLEGDAKACGELWEASLALFRGLGDAEGVARVVGNLGLLRYDLGDDEGAMKALTESLAAQRRQDNLPGVAVNLENLGMVYSRLKRYTDAEEAFAEALAIWQGTGDQSGMSLAYLNTAHLARDQQQLDRAAGLYAASLRISLALGERRQMPSAIEGVAQVLLRRNADIARDQTLLRLCARLLACAAALRESTGVSVHVSNQPLYHADLLRVRTLLGASIFEAEWAVGWDTPLSSLVEQIPGL